MAILIDSNCRRLAKDYSQKKCRKTYYKITFIYDCSSKYKWTHLEPFSDEEVTKLLALRKKYGEDDFFRHINEVFNEKRLHEVAPFEVAGIDLDTHCYKYEFKYHQITDKGVSSDSVMIKLTDETYIMLLALHLQNVNMTINSLRHSDKSTFNYILNEVDDYFTLDFHYEAKYPFVITMDEIKADAIKIRELYPDKLYKTNSITEYSI